MSGNSSKIYNVINDSQQILLQVDELNSDEINAFNLNGNLVLPNTEMSETKNNNNTNLLTKNNDNCVIRKYSELQTFEIENISKPIKFDVMKTNPDYTLPSDDDKDDDDIVPFFESVDKRKKYNTAKKKPQNSKRKREVASKKKQCTTVNEKKTIFLNPEEDDELKCFTGNISVCIDIDSPIDIDPKKFPLSLIESNPAPEEAVSSKKKINSTAKRSRGRPKGSIGSCRLNSVSKPQPRSPSSAAVSSSRLQVARRGRPLGKYKSSIRGLHDNPTKHRQSCFSFEYDNSPAISSENEENIERVCYCSVKPNTNLSCFCQKSINLFRETMTELEEFRTAICKFLLTMIDAEEDLVVHNTEVIEEFATQIVNVIMEKNTTTIAVNLDDLTLENLNCRVNVCNQPRNCLRRLENLATELLEMTLDEEAKKQPISSSTLMMYINRAIALKKGDIDILTPNEKKQTKQKSKPTYLPSLSERVVNELYANGAYMDYEELY